MYDFTWIRSLLVAVGVFGFIFIIMYIDYKAKQKRTPLQNRQHLEKTMFPSKPRLAELYAVECKEKGLSKFISRSNVEYYLEYTLKVKGDTYYQPDREIFSQSDIDDYHEDFRKRMAEDAVNKVFGVANPG